ncbi:uncharacterized protein PAN0_012c4556 [Moesziomyces antarcticus]|uniref:Related to NAB2 - nuclear polyadenylated RNA-binding protein required for nuclear mRNA export n=2 Tax=Pseudozyma antarctica TaxID=84753 RepID=A0A5C3FVL4_PSEA2|nr:uncharacterized protein PAN0_012c4556 [Moesziomyces antarcticus]GAK66334.1 conserved hypothetical protein [Moesziomyces antarcticus]SPO48468.1 related to NAB2 - nuclear polyadenylated RNA-binding protein required for nuclear mRNA export [Moesziomyces antarcticus]
MKISLRLSALQLHTTSPTATSSFAPPSSPTFRASKRSMSAFRNIDVHAAHVQELQQRIQLQLAHHNYSAHDDPVMAEYIVVMLANQKTADQVTSELQELVGTEYDPAFTEWIWTQTQECLDQAERPQAAKEEQPPARRLERRRSRSPVAGGSRHDARRSRSPPPPYSRHADDVRVRDDVFDGEAHWRRKADERRSQPRPPVQRGGAPRVFDAAMGALRKPAQNTKELFPAASATSAEGLSIFGRAGIPDPRAPAFVPSTEAASAAPAPSAPSGEPASILARIDPMLPNNDAPPTTAASEVGRSSDFPTEPSETSICRWNVGCTNPMCAYSHASPANAGPGGDPNALVLSQQNCRFGARCTNKDCTRSHVSPAVARIRPPAPAFAPAPPKVLSMDAALPSQSSSRPCRFGAACTRPDCFFAHPQRSSAATPCRFGLGCTRPDCYFTHPEGQRAIAAGGTVNRLQVFAQQQQDDEMESIIPGANTAQPEPLMSS